MKLVFQHKRYNFLKKPASASTINCSIYGLLTKCEVKIYELLTKCEVKMAGYWPRSFFACLWTSIQPRSINTQKKNEANIKPS